MKPRLGLYLSLLPKRWWEFSEEEKRQIVSTYDVIICTEPVDVRQDIRDHRSDIVLLFPWMPQLIPEATEYHEWNPQRHAEGWNSSRLLRDGDGNLVVSSRSYGQAWIDCSKPENIVWLIQWMRNAWETKLGGYDGFTLEVSCWKKPWRGFFPVDFPLDFDFELDWEVACYDFLGRLRSFLPQPIIVTGSDGLAGIVDEMDGRLVEDFDWRNSWVDDTTRQSDRSIEDSLQHCRNDGSMTIVKMNRDHGSLLGGYAAAAIWDTVFTSLDPLFADKLPAWDLSKPLDSRIIVGNNLVSRAYESGTLIVRTLDTGELLTVEFLVPPSPTSNPGCLGGTLWNVFRK